jgi:Icc-related predicted phosphoesterase
MPRLVFISDTHTLHGRLTSALIEAKADILVHCGDFTANEPGKKLSEIGDFADWGEMLLRKERVKHIVAIAGNHDEFFDPTCPTTIRRGDDCYHIGETCRNRLKNAGITYLQDSGEIVGGLAFWGTPWTGRFYDWAFQIDSPHQDEFHFSRIPSREQVNVPIDVLVTHGPPYGIRDRVRRGTHGERTEHSGSPALLRALDRVRPRIHAFGHIHEEYGMTIMPNGVLCLNAAIVSRPLNRPIVVDLEVQTTEASCSSPSES